MPYSVETDNDHISPITLVSGLANNSMYKPVVYFMCQATGYKLTSNKELPSNYQHFSRIIPKTGRKDDGSDGPDKNQRRPMFSVIDMTENNYTIKLIRIENILNSSNGFTQLSNSQGLPYYQYASDKGTERYCNWSNSPTNLITI